MSALTLLPLATCLDGVSSLPSVHLHLALTPRPDAAVVPTLGPSCFNQVNCAPSKDCSRPPPPHTRFHFPVPRRCVTRCRLSQDRLAEATQLSESLRAEVRAKEQQAKAADDARAK